MTNILCVNLSSMTFGKDICQQLKSPGTEYPHAHKFLQAQIHLSNHSFMLPFNIWSPKCWALHHQSVKGHPWPPQHKETEDLRKFRIGSLEQYVFICSNWKDTKKQKALKKLDYSEWGLSSWITSRLLFLILLPEGIIRSNPMNNTRGNGSSSSPLYTQDLFGLLKMRLMKIRNVYILPGPCLLSVKSCHHFLPELGKQ